MPIFYDLSDIFYQFQWSDSIIAQHYWCCPHLLPSQPSVRGFMASTDSQASFPLMRLTLGSSRPKEPPSSATSTSSNAKPGHPYVTRPRQHPPFPHGPKLRNLPRRFRCGCAAVLCYHCSSHCWSWDCLMTLLPLRLQLLYTVATAPQTYTEARTCAAALGAPRAFARPGYREEQSICERPPHNFVDDN
jgi:hypothetical protein